MVGRQVDSKSVGRQSGWQEDRIQTNIQVGRMANRETSYASLTVMAKLLLAFSIGGRGLHSSVSGSYLSMLLSRRVPLKPPAHKKSSHKKRGQLDLTSVIIKCLAQHPSSTVLFMRQHTNRATKSPFILKHFCGAVQING